MKNQGIRMKVQGKGIQLLTLKQQCRVRGLVCLMVLAVGALSMGNSQPPLPGHSVQEPSTVMQTKPASADIANVPTVAPQHQTAEQERRNEITADTAKLLQLANELKVEMDKSSKDMLSLSVVRKAEEIEKLAHKVRERMKSSMGN
jgi:hypothetical protein